MQVPGKAQGTSAAWVGLRVLKTSLCCLQPIVGSCILFPAHSAFLLVAACPLHHSCRCWHYMVRPGPGRSFSRLSGLYNLAVIALPIEVTVGLLFLSANPVSCRQLAVYRRKCGIMVRGNTTSSQLGALRDNFQSRQEHQGLALALPCMRNLRSAVFRQLPKSFPEGLVCPSIALHPFGCYCTM